MYLLIGFGICFLIVAVLLAFAPEGFEDDLGFHGGRRKK